MVNHPLIDAMLSLRSRTGATVGAVESIDARVHPLVLELVDRRHPRTGLEAKFSFQHSMAVAFVDGVALPAQYTDARVSDPEIAALRDRVGATVDPSLQEDAAVVTLKLKDGRAHTETVVHATGSPENPMTDPQLEDKFRVLASDVLSSRRAKRLLALLWDLDEVADIREVVALTRGRRRQPTP